jgi:hypothetical protein
MSGAFRVKTKLVGCGDGGQSGRGRLAEQLDRPGERHPADEHLDVATVAAHQSLDWFGDGIELND